MKTGILGRIAAMLVNAHDVWPSSMFRGTGKSRSVAAHARYRFSGHPKAARHWHDRNDGAQLRTLEAAQAKRDRKAEKLNRSANMGYNENNCHHSGGVSADRYLLPLSLNTFYIAK